MAAALPGFQSAAKLDPSPSREDELEDLVRRQAEQLERLQDGWIEPQSAPKCPPVTMKPEEKQALIQLLNDLGRRIEDLERLTTKQGKELEGQSEQMGLLRDGIVRLQNEVVSCKQLQDESIFRLAQDIAADRRRIASLEHPKIDTETNRARAEKIIQYASGNATPYKFIDRKSGKSVEGRIVKFEMLRLHLDCDKWQLNRALATLIKLHPGEYCKKKLKKNKWFLVELPKL